LEKGEKIDCCPSGRKIHYCLGLTQMHRLKHPLPFGPHQVAREKHTLLFGPTLNTGFVSSFFTHHFPFQQGALVKMTQEFGV